jgi:CRISPR-associated protein Csb1
MKTTIQSIADLTPEKLLASGDHRLTLQARLAPTAGRDRFQPAGFPEIGHVIYDSPHGENGKRKVCIVDSAASMANHLETVCHAGPFGMDLHPDLNGLPYVVCVTDQEKRNENGEVVMEKNDDGKQGAVMEKSRVVVTTLSEGHRLASSLFTDAKSVVEAPESIKGKNLGDVLLKEEFKLEDLGKRSHPLPADWWNVFSTIFKYDPNSLVHGILFPAMGIKIPRVLTAQMDAFGVARVTTSGVKFDKLLMTTSGQPIFAKDEETAEEIRATFVIDLALIRSFGNGEGLNDAQKQFLVAFALWKITQILQNPFRFRSGCDLEFQSLSVNSNESYAELPDIQITNFITNAKFAEPAADRITKVYWKKDDIFKKAKDQKDLSEDEADDAGEEETED